MSGKRGPRSGVCRICGCTDMSACAVGCAWIDDAHTLCSVCHDVQVTIVGLFCPRSLKQVQAAVLAELDDLAEEGDVDAPRVRKALWDLIAAGLLERASRTTYDLRGGSRGNRADLIVGLSVGQRLLEAADQLDTFAAGGDEAKGIHPAILAADLRHLAADLGVEAPTAGGA